MSLEDLIDAMDAQYADDQGHLPEVAEGRRLVYICRWGSWTPVFRMTPTEAILFASAVSKAARRVEEEQRAGSVSQAERDDHLHLVDALPGDVREVQRFNPHTNQLPPLPLRWWEGDLAVFAAGLGIAVIAWWLWTVVA